jgi:hypothetical protein
MVCWRRKQEKSRRRAGVKQELMRIIGVKLIFLMDILE